MKDCLFCKIAAGEIPSSKVYEDDKIIAFHDIDKKAPVHVLIVPKMHVASISALRDEDMAIIPDIIRVVQKISKELKLESGYRLVANTGRDGGQTVDHLHFHLLGGRPMTWPPG